MAAPHLNDESTKAGASILQKLGAADAYSAVGNQNGTLNSLEGRVSDGYLQSLTLTPASMQVNEDWLNCHTKHACITLAVC